MKAFIVAIILMCSIPAQAVEQDKVKHAGISAFLGLTADYGLFWGTELSPTERVASAFAIAMIPGVGKEVYDATQPGNKFDMQDLAADAIGAAAGIALSELISVPIWIGVNGTVNTGGRW